MYKNVNLHDDAWKYKLIDLDTNKIIKYAIWADDDLGVYTKLAQDANGIFIKRLDHTIEWETVFANIKLEKID